MLVTALCNGRWRYRSPVHLPWLHWQLGVSCADAVCCEGSYSSPASTRNACVPAHECGIGELWTAACFLCLCVCVLYFIHRWDLNVVFSLAPESGLSWKRVGLRYKSFWMLTAWRKAMKMLDCTSLPCVLSPTHVFIRKTGDSCRLYSKVCLGCLSHNRALLAVMLAVIWTNKEQAVFGTFTCCNCLEKSTTEPKHAGVCLFPSL